MNNIKNDLHKKLSEQNKEVDKGRQKLVTILSESEISLLDTARATEQAHARKKYREHFQSRIKWMRKQKKTLRRKFYFK